MGNRSAFHVRTISGLLAVIICSNLVSSSSVDKDRGLRKILIQSSNSETFTITSLSPHDHDQDTNETWRTTDFQVRNVTSLLSQYPLVSRSLPTKNSSRFFCSKKSSASLTISVKSFKHGVMFLNFSYFIGKTETSEAQQASSPENNSILPDQNLNKANTESKTSMNSTQFNSNPVKAVIANVLVPTVQTLVPEESNQSSVSISISSPPKDSKAAEESVPVKPKIRRKRRSVILESISSTPSPSPSMSPVVGDSTNEIKLEQLMTTEKSDKLDLNGNISVPTSPRAASNVTIDSLTLVQAVEMIKSAAAAISKGVVGSTTTGSVPNSVTISGRTNDLSNSQSATGNNVIRPSNDLPSRTTERTELTSPATPKLKDSSSNMSDIKGTAEITRHHHHGKSKNSSNKNLKGESKKRKSRGKKVDNAERSEKDEDSDEEDDDDDNDLASNSSSSSEEEEEIDEHEHEEKKPKISYKMWRASLEKKNRPPGLYVTVNDDIIFDNWEGIWDKHYLLGKWTGSKALDVGKWNRTSVFMNWDNVVTTGRDLTITFEWEPIAGDHELILTDIDISTMVPPETLCTSPERSNDESHSAPNKEKIGPLGQLETAKKSISALNQLNETDNQASIIVLKQGKTDKDGWEIVRIGKAMASTMGNFENLDLQQLPENNQVKVGQTEAKPENILQEILERLRLRNNLHATALPLTSPMIPLLSPKNVVLSTDQTIIPENKLTYQITPVNSVPVSIPVTVESSERATTDSSLSILTNAPPLTTSTPPSTTSTSSTTPTTTTMTTTITTSSTSTTTTTKATEKTTTTTTPSPTTTTSGTTSTTTVASSPSTAANTVPAAVPNTFIETVSSKPVVSKTRKTDNETALLVSVITGSIALVILVLTLKKRFDISSKGLNGTPR